MGGGRGEEEGVNSSLLSVKLEIRKLLSSKASHAVAFCPRSFAPKALTFRRAALCTILP